MKIYIYERGKSEIAKLCEAVIIESGNEVGETPGCDLGIAPWLLRYLPDGEISSFKIGVLIFHPSLLPMYRGKTSIKDAFENGDKYTGVTWFWAAPGYDKGEVCEQSAIKVSETTPRLFYELQAVPVAVALLRYIIADISNGVVRRRPQVIESLTRIL